MKKKLTKRRQNRVSVHSGQVEFVKVNVGGRQWRDVYQWLLALRWPRFAALVAAFYIALNLLFATLYAVDPNSIAGTTGGRWFYDCFFFSVQTLATVGYGHMYPQTLYGHVVSMIEIMSGLFLLAVVTGLIFVRFSRPVARIAFSRCLMIGPLNGQSTLMVRVGNQHQHSIVDTEFRIMFMRDEPLVEGGDYRYFYSLKLQFDKLIIFPAALTLRHVIDESSPLYGATPESLQPVAHYSRFPSQASIQSLLLPFKRSTITPGATCASANASLIFTQSGRGQLTVDYGRLHETEAAE
jgi:inward rectifier potassium channel